MSQKMIFLVDDDPDDIELFNFALKQVDKEVTYDTAGDGDTALEMLRKMEPLPDFIFLDLNMPRMNGKECLAEIKKDDRLKNIPVIICTTSSSPVDKEITMKLGAAYFLTKPLVFTDFCSEIAHVLQNINVPQT